MYALTKESGHVVWKEQWYALMLKMSLQVNLYMTQKGHVFVADAMVINPT
jgi:hypothetical protein